MKPSIAETGTVLRLDRDRAVIMLKGGGGCKGCGAAKIGLCRPGGDSMVLTVKNDAGARPGDIVTIGIDGKVRRKGYFLAYLIPLGAFMTGAFAGHLIGGRAGLPWLDVPAGFLFLASAAVLSYGRLRLLDKTSVMAVEKVLCDNDFSIDIKSDEERRYEVHAMK